MTTVTFLHEEAPVLAKYDKVDRGKSPSILESTQSFPSPGSDLFLPSSLGRQHTLPLFSCWIHHDLGREEG